MFASPFPSSLLPCPQERKRPRVERFLGQTDKPLFNACRAMIGWTGERKRSEVVSWLNAGLDRLSASHLPRSLTRACSPPADDEHEWHWWQKCCGKRRLEEWIKRSRRKRKGARRREGGNGNRRKKKKRKEEGGNSWLTLVVLQEFQTVNHQEKKWRGSNTTTSSISFIAGKPSPESSTKQGQSVGSSRLTLSYISLLYIVWSLRERLGTKLPRASLLTPTFHCIEKIFLSFLAKCLPLRALLQLITHSPKKLTLTTRWLKPGCVCKEPSIVHTIPWCAEELPPPSWRDCMLVTQTRQDSFLPHSGYFFFYPFLFFFCLFFPYVSFFFYLIYPSLPFSTVPYLSLHFSSLAIR